MTTIIVEPGESIQNAIDYLPSDGGIVELAAGIHSPASSIQIINRTNITIRGTGATREDTQIKYEGYPTFYTFIVTDSQNITFEKFTIDSNGTGYKGDTCLGGLYFVRVTGLRISNIFIRNIGIGVYFPTLDRWSPPPEEYCNNVTVEDSLFAYDKTGIFFFAIKNGTIRNSEVRNSQSDGFHMNGRNESITITESIVNQSGMYGIYIYATNKFITVENSILYNNNWVSIRLYGGNFNTTILNNIFKNNGWAIDIVAHQGGPNDFNISNNIIYNSQKDAVYIFEYGLYVGNYTGKINSNTIHSNGIGGTYDGIKLLNTPNYFMVTAKNNIITNNTGYGIDNVGGNITSSYNDIWGNVKGSYNGTSAGMGDISQDPLFANASTGDFHLKSQAGRWDGVAWVNDSVTSPAIDTGDPTSDYSNEPAPNGGRINMGAYGNTNEASKTYCLIPICDFTIKVL